MENVTPVPEEKEPLQTPDNPQDSEAADRSES